MRVERHSIDRLPVERRLVDAKDEFGEFLNTTRERPSGLTLLITSALDMAACSSVLDPGGEDVGAGLRIAAQACAAHFAVAVADGGDVEIPLGERGPVKYKGARVAPSTVHASRWLTGFFVSAICRDNVAMDSLCKVPLGLLRNSSTTAPEYRLLMVDAIMGWRRGEKDVAKRMIAAMEATDPERSDIRAPDYTLHLDVPLLECMFYGLGDDLDFRKALPKAVELHKEYWSATKKRQQNWDGFLAIGCLGMASIVFDRKAELDIESEYVPMRLVRGKF